MRIEYHKNFVKNYKKRVANNPSLNAKFAARIRLFQSNPQSPVLRNHKLVGKKENYWSFSITGDIRVVYRLESDRVMLYDIGTHNQVY